MVDITKLTEKMRKNPSNVRFDDLLKVCEHYFGEGRQRGSHHIYKTPWQGDPRINIQSSSNGKAKEYQIKQLLKAIKKLEETNDGQP